MNTIYFIEHYCLVNNQPIKLNECQKAFIQWLENNKGKNMKLTELIAKLEDLYNQFGETDVYKWNESQMRHDPVNYVKFPLADDFVEGLASDKSYVDDFNMILESVIIG